MVKVGGLGGGELKALRLNFPLPLVPPIFGVQTLALFGWVQKCVHNIIVLITQ